MPITFNPAIKLILDDLLLTHPLVHAGKMFGYPAYYVGKKLCMCVFEQGVGLKVPVETAAQLLERDPNVIPFMPLGRPKMREWIQINLSNAEDYKQYMPLFEESINYVHKQAEKTAKKTAQNIG
ncbi:MAG: hypothetical protein C3F13_18235 [Anaerolineales bacterium]|nr:MmcQ/YjbR family DNA-binding protein [Anaerolineae bacterium]PWB49778.1 MAG: hypothetical protein C3F13_18235 [Anaerolineales bacterium]